MFTLAQIKNILAVIICLSFSQLKAQKLLPFKLPETGQTTSYISTQGEDADYIINPLSFTDNGNGTITDNNTGLMWQKTDGGEMIFENAAPYCKKLTLGGYTDWRLPTSIELFSINNYNYLNPALDTNYFANTKAQYWWTSEKRKDDTTDIWVDNSGGGIGAHPKTETASAGGNRYFHVRAVRAVYSTSFTITHFTDNGDGTITDNYTGLTWQQLQPNDTMTWEDALIYSKTVILGGKSDWRLPNIKELQSLNDPKLIKPSFNKTYFTNVSAGNYWSSTTLFQQQPLQAWIINIDYGIVSYLPKNRKANVLLVRGGMDNKDLNITEALIPEGDYMMGDHYNYVDPGHPSDETPIHEVKVNFFYMSKTETTNQQFLAFLNSSLLKGLIEVKNNIIYAVGDTNIYCYTHQYAYYYSICYDGKSFSMFDFRSNHPVVGALWYGDIAFCNWLSLQNGLDECYNLKTGTCDFTKNGYRLPTEAEWEWAGRGGQIDPYYNYPWGNNEDITKANWPNSKDPYESNDTNAYPLTTPVGFYNGANHLKSEYNWSGSATSYQTSDGANAFGLYDMAGNVWELINDWYGQTYYTNSPIDNPKGPDSGFMMPDKKPYRGMRGGNWYNGEIINGVDNGHSRVSNRNPSYFRGPKDPNHPWYHVGFRVARNYTGSTSGINNTQKNVYGDIIYPNPFSKTANIQFDLSESSKVELKIYNSTGQIVATLVNEKISQGLHSYQWNAENFPSGIYSYKLNIDNRVSSKKIILIK